MTVLVLVFLAEVVISAVLVSLPPFDNTARVFLGGKYNYPIARDKPAPLPAAGLPS